MIRFLSALWNVVGLLAVIILVAEFGIDPIRRLIRRLRHGRQVRRDVRAAADAYYGAEWTDRYFAEVATIKLDWAPFVQWRQAPYHGTDITIDERGLRATPGEARDAKAGIVRIYCFGASTMVGIGARDTATVPALLQAKLVAAGSFVSVTNCAQLGYNSSQELIALQELLKAGDVPQVAMFYDGVADMLGSEWTGRAGALLSEEVRRAEFNLLRTERRYQLASGALVALMPRTLRRLREWTGFDLRGPFPSTSGIALCDAEIPALARATVDLYAANVQISRLLARDKGFEAVFFWQPVITSKRTKSADEQRWEASNSRDVTMRRKLFDTVYAEYRRHPDLAGHPDVVDLSARFDDTPDPVYVDLAHLSEPGNEMVAEAMLPAIGRAIAAARGWDEPSSRLAREE